jgi:hypothetical protein
MTWVNWGRRWWMRRICGGRRSSSARVVEAGVVAAAVDTTLQRCFQVILPSWDTAWCVLEAMSRVVWRQDGGKHERRLVSAAVPSPAAK